MLPVSHLFRIPVIQKVWNTKDFFFYVEYFKEMISKHFIALDNDSRYPSADEQNRELTRSISREVAKLSEQWNQLIDHSDNWKHSLDEYMTVSLFFALFFFLSFE